MSSGLTLGLVKHRVGLIAGIKALFDPKVSANRAVRRFLQSCYRKQPDALVRLNNVVHTAVFAPTGAGKGVSLIVPWLLENPESCVVVDFKGENFQITADERRRKGHRVVCLDPFDLVGGTDTLDPLDSIGGPDDEFALDDCASLAKSLVMRSPGEKEPHWNDSAEKWIQAFIGLAAAYGDDERSLQTIRPLLTNKEKMTKAVGIMQTSDSWDGMLARLGHQLTHAGERELGSVLTTVNRHLSWLDTPAVARNTAASTFSPDDLCRRKMTVYLVLPPKYQQSHAAMMRMWLETLMRAVVRNGLSRRKVHFLIDEAASLGHMEILDSAVDKFRGYGIRCQFYYQSIGQLKLCWPEGRDITFLSNVTQIFFAVNDRDTAQYVSDRLGEFTQVVSSGGTSCGGSSTHNSGSNSSNSSTRSWNSNDNWAPNARRLLKLEEVTALDQSLAVTLHPGTPPILTRLIKYFDDYHPRRMGMFRIALDTASVVMAVTLTAVMFTAALFYHTFR